MSRSKPDQRGGHKTKYYIADNYINRFKRNCRKSARAKAKDDLRHGREPQPIYDVEKVYFD